MRFKSIWWKIVSSYFIVGLIAVLISGLILTYFAWSYYLGNVRSHLTSNVKVLSESMRPYFANQNNRIFIDSFCKNVGSKLKERITIIDMYGKVLGDSDEDISVMENHANRPEIRQAYKGETGFSIRHSTTLKTNMMYVAHPVEIDGKIMGVARMALPTAAIYGSLRKIWILIFASAALAGIISIILSLILARKITHPINRMSRMAQSIAKGKLDQKIRISTGDEIEELAKNLNFMASQLHQRMGEISSERTKMKIMLSNVVDGILVTEPQSRIVIFNPAAEKIFRLSAQEALGKRVIEVTHNHKIDNLIAQALRGKRSSQEIKISSYPREKIIKIKTNPLKDEGGQIFGAIATVDDVTKVRRLEQIRRDFIANVSHELRTPITSIKALIETLLIGARDDPNVNQQFLENIHGETERLSTLVNDILNLSRLESEKAPLKKERVSFEEIIGKAVEKLKLPAQKKDIQVDVDIASKLPLIKVDEEQIFMALVNLVDNAIKYTSYGGKVKIRAHEDGKSILVSVEDTGIGIPSKDIPRIFERFYRVDGDRSRESGGTGLGLSIVKHVIKNHGGTIRVESVLGKGSKFIITLPNQSSY